MPGEMISIFSSFEGSCKDTPVQRPARISLSCFLYLFY